MKKIGLSLLVCLFITHSSPAQDVTSLLQKVKNRLNVVNDYEASGRIKTKVAFLKVPLANVKIYYKKPDRLKIRNEKGISFIPKGSASINLNSLFTGINFTALDGGTVKLGDANVRIVKLLPEDEENDNDIVLSTLYIDEEHSLIRKSRTTTKDNGTYQLEMIYGKYANYGLPDKVIFTFNTKHKLPKGFTFDFDDGSRNNVAAKKTIDKGIVEITYTSYIINAGVSESIFK
jgi:outer membrane lipoprotein-sorting protein